MLERFVGNLGLPDMYTVRLDIDPLAGLGFRHMFRSIDSIRYLCLHGYDLRDIQDE